MCALWQVIHLLDFVDTTFVIVWGGVFSLSFHVFYCIGASECYSYVSVFEQVGYFMYLWAVICEGCPYFMIVVSFMCLNFVCYLLF
jgi:hypothetical protein